MVGVGGAWWRGVAVGVGGRGAGSAGLGVSPPLIWVRETTPRGFEPLRAEPNGFLVHLLNHSDTVSCWSRRPCYPYKGAAA